MITIEEWKKDFKEYIDGLYLLNDDYKGIMEYIDEVPTVETDIEVVAQDAYKQGYTDGWKERFGEPNEKPQGEWIPVSERLPDVEQDVLVCLIYKDTTHFVVTRLLNNKQWLCFSDVEVIAWQPLPEPYKEGGAE